MTEVLSYDAIPTRSRIVVSHDERKILIIIPGHTWRGWMTGWGVGFFVVMIIGFVGMFFSAAMVVASQLNMPVVRLLSAVNRSQGFWGKLPWRDALDITMGLAIILLPIALALRRRTIRIEVYPDLIRRGGKNWRRREIEQLIVDERRVDLMTCAGYVRLCRLPTSGEARWLGGIIRQQMQIPEAS